MSRPLILVTNDDGYSSKGIKVLSDVASNFGETIIVAPNSEKSGKAHGITLYDPIRLEKIDTPDKLAYSINGTPVDCVKLAINSLLPRKPKLILSGVNHGLNVGRSILYSGTVSASSESIMIGIPSIAFSLQKSLNMDFTNVNSILEKIINCALMKDFPNDVIWNVNIPSSINKKSKGIKLTKQGKSNFNEIYHKRKDPRNNIYFWVDGMIDSMEDDPNVDEVAIRNGYVSITPLTFELTSQKYLENSQYKGFIDFEK